MLYICQYTYTKTHICRLFTETNLYQLPACFCCCHALTMTGISVPEMADVKDVVTLTCTYDLGRTKLNSVKWYKDGSEFFRFVCEQKIWDYECAHRIISMFVIYIYLLYIYSWHKAGSNHWICHQHITYIQLAQPTALSTSVSHWNRFMFICRYSPMMFPSIMTFPMNGVHLKPDQSYLCNKEICSVMLDNMKRKSSGSYRCEISGDAPEFHVVHETANMTLAGMRIISTYRVESTNRL